MLSLLFRLFDTNGHLSGLIAKHLMRQQIFISISKTITRDVSDEHANLEFESKEHPAFDNISLALKVCVSLSFRINVLTILLSEMRNEMYEQKNYSL